MIREVGTQGVAVLLEPGTSQVVDLPPKVDKMQVVCDKCADASPWMHVSEKENLPISTDKENRNDGKTFVMHEGGHLCWSCWDRIRPVKSWEERILEDDKIVDPSEKTRA